MAACGDPSLAEDTPSGVQDAGQVTCVQDLKPVLAAYCETCPQNGGIGPQPDELYEQVAPLASLLAAATPGARRPITVQLGRMLPGP